jgi:DNA-binding NarL/FixJ family response regulator
MEVNVLVVEDEHQVREGISEFITEIGSPYRLVGMAAKWSGNASTAEGMQAPYSFNGYPHAAKGWF